MCQNKAVQVIVENPDSINMFDCPDADLCCSSAQSITTKWGNAMKKMNLQRMISACIIGVLLLVVLTVVIVVGVMLHQGRGLTIGRCLVAENGSYMLIDENSPIVMSDRSSGKDLFFGLSTGDKILVIHDGIAESYPGQTGAYFCLRLSKGDISNISEEVITSLKELGWLGEED